jgi:FtsZ-binding cell division protein ZapB
MKVPSSLSGAIIALAEFQIQGYIEKTALLQVEINKLEDRKKELRDLIDGIKKL